MVLPINSGKEFLSWSSLFSQVCQYICVLCFPCDCLQIPYICTSSGETKQCSSCYISLIDTKLNYKQHFVWSMGELEEKKSNKLVLAQNGHWRIVAAKTLQNTLWRTILHLPGASSAPDLQLLQLCKLCRKPFHLYQPKIQLTVKHIWKNFLVKTCLKFVSSTYQKSSLWWQKWNTLLKRKKILNYQTTGFSNIFWERR